MTFAASLFAGGNGWLLICNSKGVSNDPIKVVCRNAANDVVFLDGGDDVGMRSRGERSCPI